MCREYADGFVKSQREQFQRLGVMALWDEPYLTMNYDYQASILRTFGELAAKGFVKKVLSLFTGVLIVQRH